MCAHFIFKVRSLCNQRFYLAGYSPHVSRKISLDTRMGTGFAGEIIFSGCSAKENKSCGMCALVKQFLTI
jgi:hypothetical protein